MNRFYVTRNDWLPKIAQRCREAGVIGVDCETCAAPGWENSKDAALDPFRNRIRLIQIATDEFSWIIDLNRVTNIQPILEVLVDPNVLKVGHNLKFETMNFLHHFGVYPDPIFDTMLADILFKPAYDYFWKSKLDILASRWLNENLPKDQQLSDWSVGELTEEQKLYAHRDAEIVLALYKILRARLLEEGMARSAKIEFDAVLGLSDMELAGLTIDREIHQLITSAIVERIGNLKKYLTVEFPSRQYGLFEPEGINIDSPKQLLSAFKERTGVTPVKWDSKKKQEVASTSKEALLPHRKNFPELIDALVDYASLSQNLSTYCTPLLDYIHPATGRIHPDYFQIAQWQHRAQISKPNMNWPRPNSWGPTVSTPCLIKNFKFEHSFREIIRAGDGNLFSIIDFANNQLRIVADTPFANEESLIEEFNLPKADPYRRIASNGLGISKDQVSNVQRFAYKTITLGFLFIMQLKKFMQVRLDETREEISYGQAKSEMESFFRALPGVGRWHRERPLLIQERGYCLSALGRRVVIPDLFFTPNRGVNYEICMTEVDGAKMALGAVSRALRGAGYSSRPVAFVHDEIVVEGPVSEMEAVHELQKKVMTDCMNQCLTAVPAVAEGKIGVNWSDKA
jgi:DNA polymerase-1